MPSPALRRLLEWVVVGNARDDGPLMANLDQFIHNEAHPMNERVLAVRKIDECIGEMKMQGEVYNEQDVAEYIEMMRQVREGTLPLELANRRDDGRGN
jgi:hypothetical protein